MRRIGVFAAALIAGLSLGAVELTEDKPPAPAPKPGDVRGRIVVADGGGNAISGLTAVSRITGKKHPPAQFDAKTGRFLFRGLPGDRRYDICFSTADGRRIEGIDLDFVDQRLVRLATERRKQLGLPPERAHTFSKDDVAGLLQYVKEMKEFMEDRRVLYIHGQGFRATLLVELMRTRKFYAAKAQEVIWRIELWYFKNEFGGWDKLPNQERVLHRRKIPFGQWRKISLEYYPQLSVYVSPAGRAEPIEFKLPAKADPSRGRAAGTHPKIKTRPHVLGLPAAESPAAGPTAGQSPRPAGQTTRPALEPR